MALAKVEGVARVDTFGGGFVAMGGRRVWVVARPGGDADKVLAQEIVAGSPRTAAARLAEGGWVAVSAQIAAAAGVGLGDWIEVPTPSGVARLRVAATTTNLAWSPGVVFLGMRDFGRLWHTGAPTALAIYPQPGAEPGVVRARVQAVLDGSPGATGPGSAATPTTPGATGPGSVATPTTPGAVGPGSRATPTGLVAVDAAERERSIDGLTSEGLGQLGEISNLLLAVAVLALAAALGSAIWQRRAAMAGLRLSGVRPRRLRAILLIEATLMLSAGCLTGALVGLYGELVIDRYLTHVTGFPVGGVGASARPFELLAVIAATVLALVAAPAWQASKVSPTFAFSE